MPIDLISPLRHTMQDRMRSAVSGSGFPFEQYTDPPGDPGLFGPDSIAWRIHADEAVGIGGIAALMLQTLHPLAMAGVAEHSNYREAPLERLARTGAFVRGTVFGSTEVAERMIATVRRVHRRVVGVAPDGRPYSASDPDLLRWVHTVETSSFVRAHRRYAMNPVRGAEIDRYYAEMAVVAEKLGATDVPGSRAEVGDYFAEVRPALAKTEEVIRTIDFLTHPATGSPPIDGALRVMALAAIDLVPEWGRRLLDLGTNRVVELSAIRPAAWALLTAARVTFGVPQPVSEARARCAAGEACRRAG